MGVNTELPSYQEIVSVGEREALRTSRDRWRTIAFVAMFFLLVIAVLAVACR